MTAGVGFASSSRSKLSCGNGVTATTKSLPDWQRPDGWNIDNGTMANSSAL